MRVFCSFVAQLMLLLPATVGAAIAAAPSCAGFVSRSQYSVVRASSRTINADASAAAEQSSSSSPRLVSRLTPCLVSSLTFVVLVFVFVSPTDSSDPSIVPKRTGVIKKRPVFFSVASFSSRHYVIIKRDAAIIF